MTILLLSHAAAAGRTYRDIPEFIKMCSLVCVCGLFSAAAHSHECVFVCVELGAM